MNKDEQIDILKSALDGAHVSVARARDDEVRSRVLHTYDRVTRRLTLEVQLDAQPGQAIENFATALSYKMAGGKGSAPALCATRSWGVAEGPQIVTGIDITVLGSGKFPAECTVGTFVKIDGGYRMWLRTEKFDVDASQT